MKFFVRQVSTGLYWDGVKNDIGKRNGTRPSFYKWRDPKIRAWNTALAAIEAMSSNNLCPHDDYAVDGAPGRRSKQSDIYQRSPKPEPETDALTELIENAKALTEEAPEATMKKKPADQFCYQFPAIRGIQSGHEYYSVMVPLRLLPKLFTFDSEDLPPEERAQRILQESRAKAIAKYVLESEFFVIPSLTVSVSAQMAMEVEPGSDMGLLKIPLDAKLLINDGQHRARGLKMALKENPELGDETVNCIIFWDLGLKRSQTIFSDINLNASKPPNSISRLYDHRDPLAEVVRLILNRVPALKALTEMEKGSVSKRSTKLFTLQLWYEFVKVLHPTIALAMREELGEHPSDHQISERLANILLDLREVLPAWQGTYDATELRAENISVSGVALIAIAKFLALLTTGMEERTQALGEVNWHRSNPDWQNLIIFDGRLMKNTKTVNGLMQHFCKRVPGL